MALPPVHGASDCRDRGPDPSVPEATPLLLRVLALEPLVMAVRGHRSTSRELIHPKANNDESEKSRAKASSSLDQTPTLEAGESLEIEEMPKLKAADVPKRYTCTPRGHEVDAHHLSHCESRPQHPRQFKLC